MLRPHNKLYNSKRWKRLRKAQLYRKPYCECPNHKGKRIKADTVDHIQPHQGDTRLFYNPSNLQSLLKVCHDAGKKTKEMSGYWPGCDEFGLPTDPNHPWNS